LSNLEVQIREFEVKGQVPAKANNYRLAGKYLYKVKAVLEYEKAFAWQVIGHESKDIFDHASYDIELDVYFRSKRSDLDNGAKTILDCLQKNGIIKNDNMVYRIIMNKYIDKKDPRCIIKVKTYYK